MKHFWQQQWDGRPIKVVKDAALFSASQFNPHCPFTTSKSTGRQYLFVRRRGRINHWSKTDWTSPICMKTLKGFQDQSRILRRFYTSQSQRTDERNEEKLHPLILKNLPELTILWLSSAFMKKAAKLHESHYFFFLQGKDRAEWGGGSHHISQFCPIFSPMLLGGSEWLGGSFTAGWGQPSTINY